MDAWEDMRLEGIPLEDFEDLLDGLYTQIPTQGNPLSANDTETTLAQVDGMVDSALNWEVQESQLTAKDVGCALWYSNMSSDKAAAEMSRRHGQMPQGENMFLSKGVPSNMRSQAIVKYTELANTVNWDARYKDVPMCEDGIRLICNEPKDGEQWVHSYKNDIGTDETRPRHDVTTKGELIKNVLETDLHNKLRFWVMPPGNVHKYDNCIPSPIKETLNDKTVVFVGILHYGKDGFCEILTQQDMQSQLVVRQASTHNIIQCNDYVTFKEKKQGEWCTTHGKELSLVAVQFPKRRANSPNQYCFSISIEFYKTAPSGVYEPVIFLLQDVGIEGAYQLIPVVKCDMAVVCADENPSSTPTEMPSTSNGLLSSTDFPDLQGLTTYADQPSTSSGFLASTYPLALQGPTAYADQPSTSTRPHQNHTNGKRAVRSNGSALDADNGRLSPLSRVLSIEKSVDKFTRALERIAAHHHLNIDEEDGADADGGGSLL